MKRLNPKKRLCQKTRNAISGILFLSIFLLSSNTAIGTEKEIEISESISEPVSSAKPMPSKLRGTIAPDFILDSMTGEEYKLSYTRGKIVLIDFWHTY